MRKGKFLLTVFVGFALTNEIAHAQLTITTSGQIGIGVTTPEVNTKLHVVHNNLYAGYFTSNVNSTTAKVLRAEYTGSGSYDARAVYGRSVPVAGKGYGGEFIGGYIGIVGTATAAGSGNRAAVIATAGGGSSVIYGVLASGSGGSTNYAGYFSGNVTFTGAFSNPSDENLKDDVDSLRAVLPLVTKLNPITFTYKKDPQYQHMNLPSGTQYGFVAQDLEALFPDLVKTESHPSAEEQEGGSGGDPLVYKSVNLIALIPILVEAIKEQQKMIDDLKAQVNSLSQK